MGQNDAKCVFFKLFNQGPNSWYILAGDRLAKIGH